MDALLDILLADDEPSIRLALGDALVRAGHRVVRAADGGEAAARLREKTFDLLITDISMPKVDGITLFRNLRAQSPMTDVILITAHGKLNDAIEALKDGALDYLTKPFHQTELLMRVRRVAELRALKNALVEAQKQLDARAGAGTIVGRSRQIVSAVTRIDTIAASDAPVLILGESGTGKELAARRIHAMSTRAGEAFCAINCAAFPETLIEAELFGHERGAFTGAMQRREGRFKAADGGTLFLDEVAELPLAVQAKLLRVLQGGEFAPIGSNVSVKVDVRIVSATHRHLRKRIEECSFREDLYYRLNVLDVHLPPLRERDGDLPILIEHFVKIAVARGAKAPKGFSPRAFAALSEYPFPGNVRELQHACEHAVVLAAGDEIQIQHLPRDIVGLAEAVPAREPFRQLSEAAREFEREYLLRALSAARGKKGKAAEMLGISRKNLWEKLRQHGISEAHSED